jgi:hypothetical protein
MTGRSLDRAVRRLGQQRVLTPDIFRPLLAYVGDVIRRVIGGRWEMRREKKRTGWEPWITAPVVLLVALRGRRGPSVCREVWP